jgi:hypothetical protein
MSEAVGSEPTENHRARHPIPAGDLVRSRGFRTHGKIKRRSIRSPQGILSVAVGSEPTEESKGAASDPRRGSCQKPWVPNPRKNQRPRIRSPQGIMSMAVGSEPTEESKAAHPIPAGHDVRRRGFPDPRKNQRARHPIPEGDHVNRRRFLSHVNGLSRADPPQGSCQWWWVRKYSRDSLRGSGWRRNISVGSEPMASDKIPCGDRDGCR